MPSMLRNLALRFATAIPLRPTLLISLGMLPLPGQRLQG
jgi:hypothetical protein